MFGFGKKKKQPQTNPMFPPPPPPPTAVGGPMTRTMPNGGGIAAQMFTGMDTNTANDSGPRTLPPSLPPRKNLLRKASAAFGFQQRKSSVPGPPPMGGSFFGLFAQNRNDIESVPPPPPPGRAGPGNKPPTGATPMRKGTIPLPPPPRFRKKAAPPEPKSMAFDEPPAATVNGGMMTRIKSSFTMARGSIPLPPPPRRRYKGGMGKKKGSNNYIGDPPEASRNAAGGVGPVAPPRDFPPPQSLAVNRVGGGITIPPPPPRDQKKKTKLTKRPSAQALGGLRRFASNMKLAAKETMYGFGDAVRPPPPPPTRSKGAAKKTPTRAATNNAANVRKVAKQQPVRKPQPVRGALHRYGDGSLKKLNNAGSKPGTLKRVNSGKSATSAASGTRDWVKVPNKGWTRASTLELGPVKPWMMKKVNTVDNGQVSRYHGNQNGTWKKTTPKPKAGTMGRPKKNVNVPFPDPSFAPYGSRVNSVSSNTTSKSKPDPASVAWKADPKPGLRSFESRFDFWFKREGSLR